MTTKESTEQEELAVLFPEALPFPIGKIVLQIMPMNLCDCAHFAMKARPIIDRLMQVRPSAGQDFMDAAMPQILLAAAEYPNELIGALAIASGKDPEFIGKLSPGQAMALATVIFQVNADFFAQSVGQLGVDVLRMAVGPSDGAGQTH